MIFVNPQQEYVEPLILADSTAAFGQQSYLFKNEDFGHSLIFTTTRRLDNKRERHNFCRMPLKSDFIKTLRKYARLPYSEPKQMVKDYSELKAKNLQLEADAKEKDEQIKKLKAKAEEL